MAKPTGFLDYRRQTPSYRHPQERILDWREFLLPLTEAEQKRQGARCMDCGVPFCHSGHMLQGMVSGCPLHNLIPEWNELLYRGLWQEAASRLFKTNVFPEFTGRVCPAPCEGSCTLGIHEPPVTVKANELAIVEKAFQEGWVKPHPPRYRSGKKVAIVGSGPCGLACAHFLNQEGHHVTVYERDDHPGGLLMYGIPNMKLEKDIVLRRLELMKAAGIRFCVNTEVGRDISAEELYQKNDALILCAGAAQPRDLQVEGRSLQGIHFAIDFLKSNTKRLLQKDMGDAHYISAAGKDVVVIGGGDTGTDCVATSLRHGCRSIAQFEILPSPPGKRLPQNPWPQWPKTLKTDYGQEEAIAVFGQDPREFGVRTLKFCGDPQGKVAEVHTVQVAWIKGPEGNFIPQDLPKTEKIWPAQLILLSMGFLGAEETLFQQLGLGNAQIHGFQTDYEGLFIAGDMRRGQSLVVWAIQEGREAAKSCHSYLTGQNQRSIASL